MVTSFTYAEENHKFLMGILFGVVKTGVLRGVLDPDGAEKIMAVAADNDCRVVRYAVDELVRRLR